MQSPAASMRPLLRAFSIASKQHIDMVDPMKVEMVLSESNRKACIKKFKSFPMPKLRNVAEAAVLVPLCLHKGELGFLYTLRSMKLTSNRGQVSFPGGMRDKSDVDLQETALRETWEELKIPREKIDVWTTGNLIGKSDVNVMPVLAYIGEVVPKELEINPDEVEEAFVVSLQKLCDPKLISFTSFRRSLVTLPCYLGGKYRVWGFTGAITHMALECLVPQVYKYKFLSIQPMQKNESEKKKSVSSDYDATRSKI
ncbi:PREDICTED: nucleoside diphosphate-linked moiety X motif 8, mitochondrial [Acromyrmex echinatior]|nr:PREDICTED: nucleoside diphosphate-linked moiety X motif 8, mitochondrial [Acromyrmex echinatior]